VIVLDHHISSLERYRSDLATVNAMEADGHQIHFDLSHSGAVLSWEFFCADEAVPDLLLYVEDQDLWNWKLPRSREVNAAIGSYPMRFESWTELAGRPIEELAEEGAPIVRANEAEVRRVLHHSHPCRIGERRVQAVNSSYVRAAIGHALAEEAAFELQWGLVYRLRGDMVLITLYSIGDLDVSAVAAEYGGGGHRNAAGFNVSLERWLNDFA
jgi:oligoribonuclease NrnB/cAMP/cGMP phosphodiesterase (DHH superfamily)